MDAPPPTVEQHYDLRAVVKRKREDDPDYQARLYNNAVKAQLIETCVPIESTVLDLACIPGIHAHLPQPESKHACMLLNGSPGLLVRVHFLLTHEKEPHTDSHSALVA